MILDKIKHHFANREKKVVFNNFISLGILQVSNYLIPLLVIPYLARVLGPEKFGLTSFAQAVIFYFTLVTDFGFNLTATKEISINRDLPEKISEIFSAVITIKVFLLLLSFISLLALTKFYNQFATEKTLYYYTFLTVIGSVLFPQWYYQGTEKMKFVTLITVATRIVFTGLIFIFVKNSDDYIIYALLNSMGFFVSGLIGFAVSLYLMKVKFRFLSITTIKRYFAEAWHIFLSTVSISLYTTSNSVVLGLFTNYTIVGYYTAAEKLFKVFQFMGMPFYQAVFPYFSKLYNENKSQALNHFNKIFKYVLIVSFFISLLLLLVGRYLVIFLYGSNFSESIILFSILSLILVPSWGNYVLGIQGMINFCYKELLARIIIYFGLFHIFLILIGTYWGGIIFIPCIWLLTESLIFLYEFVFLTKKSFLFASSTNP